MEIRDRIKAFRRVPAAKLRPNPRNWRTHPDSQRNALRSLLASIGIVGAVLARETDDGALEIIDGHLRHEELPDQKIPTIILDVTAEEADRLLLTYDPLGDMAELDRDALGRLLAAHQDEAPAVKALLDDLAREASIDLYATLDSLDSDPSPSADGTAPDEGDARTGIIECPECGHKFKL